MAMIKYPYELSVWKEELKGSNKKIESKGVIIGAHDMDYQGKAVNIVLTRKLNGTNTLTFSLPDRYFDSLKGDFVRNEFIDVLSPESKIKLHYKDRWYEFFIKKTDEKKVYKSYMKTFTCTDAFIDELSRNGYGITFDTELNNNVEELGVFTKEVLEDSLWHYAPQYNWGDFTEFKEEKLFKIPTSQFYSITGYKLDFLLSNKQLNSFEDKEITNVTTGEKRSIVLSDDIARRCFWDQRDDETGIPDNPLKKTLIENIQNDGFIYVPYSCLNFCYGSNKVPEDDTPIAYDRAATEIALKYPDSDKLAIAPASVDPRTLIQFYAFPKDYAFKIDDAGVILDADNCYFMTLRQWNENISAHNWYFFEDTRLVSGEILGSADLKDVDIRHTYRYIKTETGVLNTPKEALGNKCVTYDGYLSDINDTSIIKGKKFSITNRTEVNISEDIDQYITVYNNNADEFVNEYTNDTWQYEEGDLIPYKVCSKIETRQIIPQLARNLVQNGIKMNSEDGWSPMSYVSPDDTKTQSPTIKLRTIKFVANPGDKPEDEIIDDTALFYASARSAVGYKYSFNQTKDITELSFDFPLTGGQRVTVTYNDLTQDEKYLFSQLSNLICKVGKRFYLQAKETENDSLKYIFICEMTTKDPIYVGLCNIGDFVPFIEGSDTIQYEYPKLIGGDDGTYEGISYTIQDRDWAYDNGLVYTKHDAQIQSNEDLASACSIINFGIVGQQETIKKDKVYCVGISAFSEANDAGYFVDEAFDILIGEGSLVQDGVYKINEENAIKLKSNYFYPVGDIAGNNPNWNDLDTLTNDVSIVKEPDTKFIFLKSNVTIKNPYIVIKAKKRMLIFELYLFECYTKGIDNFSESGLKYRYSGRDIFWPVTTEVDINEDNFSISPCMLKDEAKKYVIFEDDIMLGATYEYQHYFIQRLKAKKIVTDEETGKNCTTYKYFDTTGKKSFVDTKGFVEGELPLDAAEYSIDDCEIETNYIDLNRCQFYDKDADIHSCDCHFGGGKHSCFYQRFGYCPYRFETEKHNRRIRTLSVQKSNRFNIIQSESKVFEVYPQFYIQHNNNGTVQTQDDVYLKQVYFITEKGKENKIGFRYEKNLKDISRTISSENIVTKLYVLDVDSELSKTGLCSIKTAEDNVSADSFIIDLSYYIAKGMLDSDEVEQDLYGIYPLLNDTLDAGEIPSGFLRQLGYYNNRYDELTNNIINLQDASYTELEANLTVNLAGIVTAQEQILKYKQQIENYKQLYEAKGIESYTTQSTYKNYLAKLHEQEAVLNQLIYDTFFTDGEPDKNQSTYFSNSGELYAGLDEILANQFVDWEEEVNTTNPLKFFSLITDFKEIQKTWVDEHIYTHGILGQYNKEYLQLQSWKKERASYLKLINQISSAFYKKYEPYLKEGTWSDSNYLSDNAYYFGALDVAAQGAIPKVAYNISVIDIAQQNPEYEFVYDFDIADTTYVEDIGMFGINKKTGLPNKLKVLIGEVSECLDDASKNNAKVQNYTTQFEDLFQQVTATVQNLTFNENIYRRSSNFTSLQSISNKSLQGALDTNQLTLLNTNESNIRMDNTGTSGSDINNHANKYRLDGQGLYFSNDGGQHWSVGVGPKGINADYIKVGTLDAGKIRIADSSYVYFSWDKNGIVAYRDPQGINTDDNNANDAAVFNKYGLSIVKNGVIKLRAGYSYGIDNPLMDGRLDSETEQESNIGFYLYNDMGVPIFQTTEEGGGARIQLRGEIFVTNDTNSSDGTIGNTYMYYKRYTFTNETCYDIESSNNQPKVYTGVYDDYMGKQPGDTIGTLVVATHTISIVHTLCGNGNVYEMTKHSFTFENGPAISFCSTFSNGVHYYYELLGTSSTKTFYSVNDSDQAGPGNVYLTPQTYTCEYNTSIYQTDGQTGLKYYTNMNQSVNLYSYNSGLWASQVLRTGNNGASGNVALFMNNTNTGSIDGGDIDTGADRLFICCKENLADTSNPVANLFSILKGGNLYIGGTVQKYYHDEDSQTEGYVNAQSISEIGTRININNPGIFITKNQEGKFELRMDFNNIKNQDGTSLFSAIDNKASSGHWHDYTFFNYWIDRIEWKDFDQDEWDAMSPEAQEACAYILNHLNIILEDAPNVWGTSGPIG